MSKVLGFSFQSVGWVVSALSRALSQLDGVFAFIHHGGGGMIEKEDLALIRRTVHGLHIFSTFQPSLGQRVQSVRGSEDPGQNASWGDEEG